MQSLKEKILEKWDWWIYRRAYHSIRRMVKRNPGFAYLFQLHIEGWNRENPIPDNLKEATEKFHESLHPKDPNRVYIEGIGWVVTPGQAMPNHSV